MLAECTTVNQYQMTAYAIDAMRSRIAANERQAQALETKGHCPKCRRDLAALRQRIGERKANLRIMEAYFDI